MQKLSKGTQTKNKIIIQSNLLYNTTDTLLTLDELADRLNLSRSSITNHFPKKELLLLAIFKKYEESLHKLVNVYKPDSHDITLSRLFKYYAKVMDLMYEYRFAISYIFVQPLRDIVLKEYIREIYKINKRRLKERTEYLVTVGLFSNKILNEDLFEVFNFQHSNLLTTWIINYRLYDYTKSYQQRKSVYMRGLVNCFVPFLTENAMKEIETILKTKDTFTDSV